MGCKGSWLNPLLSLPLLYPKLPMSEKPLGSFRLPENSKPLMRALSTFTIC